MAKNWAEKMKTPALVAWEPERTLTPYSVKYKQAALELAMRYMRGKPCVFCGGMETPDSVGHHIIIRVRSTKLVAAFENIIPTCRKHHCSGHACCAHPINRDTSAAGEFWAILLRRMPKRMSIVLLSPHEESRHDFKSDFEFWVDVWKKDMDYESVCQMLGIEAYPEEC